MMPSGLGFGNLGNQGSPTRMEMGQGGNASQESNAGVEVPVPSTPPGVDDARGVTFGMQGNGNSVTPGVGNLGFAGNLGNAGSLGVGGLAGSFGSAGSLHVPNVGGCPYSNMSPMTGPFNPQGNVQPGFSGFGPSVPMSSSGICSGARGVMPGGGMTQASKLQQIAELVGSLDANQTRTLQQMLGERLDSQSRMNPEFFGDVPRDVRGQPGFGSFGDANVRLPGVPEGEHEGSYSRDIFAKTEKWLSPAPVPEVSKWTNRELEIVGFNEYVTQLASWAAQASLEFSNEILQSSRWHDSIPWSSLTSVQKNRASRLLAILRAAFSTHPRTSMLVSAYMEGINLHRMNGSEDDVLMNSQGANGFELLRQLTHEYSLRSRAEALSLRASLATKSFVFCLDLRLPR